MRFVAKNTELLAVLLCSEIEQKKRHKIDKCLTFFER